MEVWSGQQVGIVGQFALSGTAQTPTYTQFTIWHSASGSARFAFPGSAEIVQVEVGELVVNWRFDYPGYWRWHWQGMSGVLAAAASGLVCRVPW